MAEKVKIARQGMTWRHIAIVVTMCLSIFTAVGITLLLQACVIVPLHSISVFRSHKFLCTSPLFT